LTQLTGQGKLPLFAESPTLLFVKVVDAQLEIAKDASCKANQVTLHQGGRYLTMHERAFHKCLADLLKLRAEKQKQEIGFASQARKEELHRVNLRCREGLADYQQTRVASVKCDIYRQEKRFETALARENREFETQKAA
jgi:hypothetical protein